MLTIIVVRYVRRSNGYFWKRFNGLLSIIWPAVFYLGNQLESANPPIIWLLPSDKLGLPIPVTFHSTSGVPIARDRSRVP